MTNKDMTTMRPLRVGRGYAPGGMVKTSKGLPRLTTVMVRNGRVFDHDPATVGHAWHDKTCWTPRKEG